MHAGLFEPLRIDCRGAGGGGRRSLLRVRAADGVGQSDEESSRGQRAGVPLRRLDAGAGRGALSGLRVVLHPERSLSAVRHDLHRRHWRVRHLRRSELSSHVQSASTCPARHPRAGDHPCRPVRRAGFRDRRRLRGGVLSQGWTPGGAAAARRRVEPGSAQRIRALVGPAGAGRSAVLERRGEGPDREVQRLSVPAVPADLLFLRADPGEVQGSSAGREVSVAPFSRSTRAATPACRSWCTLRPATRRRRR